MNTSEVETPSVVPSLELSFLHFLAGLDAGLGLALAYFFLTASQPHGRPSNATFDAIVLMGLGLPVLLSAAGVGLSWWRPLRFPRGWMGFVIWLGLLGGLVFLTLACLIVVFLISFSFSGYC